MRLRRGEKSRVPPMELIRCENDPRHWSSNQRTEVCTVRPAMTDWTVTSGADYMTGLSTEENECVI